MLLKWAPALAFSLLLGPNSSTQGVSPVPRTEIVIDVGHGGVDSGTTYGKILEKDINLAVGLKLYPLLQKHNVAVSINRTKDYALSDDNRRKKGNRHKRDLAQRVDIANKLKPAFMLSLHVNWATNKSRGGPLVIYPLGSDQGKQLAIRLQRELNALYNSDTEPEPSRSYYVLAHSDVPSVIVEMGFLSNAHDRKLLVTSDFQRKLAEAISRASLQSLEQDFGSKPANKGK